MLQVDGSLHLYTTLLGWQLYGVVWDLLKATGLVWLPIVGVLIDHIAAVRARGSLMSSNAESAFAGLEVQFFFIIIVILIGVIPRTPLSPTNINYRDVADVYHTGDVDRTIGSTSSRLDTTTQSTIATTTSVDVPLWWYVVMQTSNGFRYALENNMDVYGNSYRALRSVANTVGISNPDLKRKVDEFHSFCYLPALSKYRTGISDGTDKLVGTAVDSEVVGPDVTWIGSEVFVADYYPNQHMPYIVPGYAYDPTWDTEYASDPGAGAPTCSEYWTDIREDIYVEADDRGFRDLLIGAAPFLATPLNSVSFLNPDKDEIAQIYLSNRRPEFSQTANRMVTLRMGDADVFTKFGRTVTSVAQVYQYAKMASLLELALDALIYALIIGQAYLLMVIYMSLPFALLLGRYSFATLMGGAVLIFAVNFFSVLWTVVAFVDNWLALQMWEGQGVLRTFWVSGLEETKKRLVHAIAIGSLYLTATVGFGWVLLIGGSRIGYAISGAGRAGAAGFSPAGGGIIGGGGSARGAARGVVSTIGAKNSYSTYKKNKANGN